MTTKKYAYFTPLSPLIFAWLDYATEQRRKHGRFLYEIGDKEYAIALQIPWTPMTTYFLVQQTWQPCPQPSVQLLSTWEGRISTKGDLPSDQQSFLGTPVIPVLVCLRCDKQPRPMPTKSSGKKEDMKRGAVAGRQKFHFISIKKKKKKKSSAHHPSFCRKRPRAQIPSSSPRRIRLCQTGASFHPRAASRTLKNVRCGFLLPISRSPPEDFGVSYFSVICIHKMSSTIAGGSMFPCCRR